MGLPIYEQSQLVTKLDCNIDKKLIMSKCTTGKNDNKPQIHSIAVNLASN